MHFLELDLRFGPWEGQNNGHCLIKKSPPGGPYNVERMQFVYLGKHVLYRPI